VPRVRLRPVTLRDLDRIMSWINDPEVVSNIANINASITRAQEARWLRKTLKSPNDRLFSIEDARTGEYIGQCGIHQIYWPARNGRLAVIIRKESQGRGYGKAAMEALLRVAFRSLLLHKVWAIVREDNPVTVHLNRDVLGMREEGRLIDEYRVNGRYHTMLRLAMLESEYRLRARGAKTRPSRRPRPSGGASSHTRRR
jgi:RimJ/RimL family protein N-acetyltransferase